VATPPGGTSPTCPFPAVILHGRASEMTATIFEAQARQSGRPLVGVDGGHLFLHEDLAQAETLVSTHAKIASRMTTPRTGRGGSAERGAYAHRVKRRSRVAGPRVAGRVGRDDRSERRSPPRSWCGAGCASPTGGARRAGGRRCDGRRAGAVSSARRSRVPLDDTVPGSPTITLALIRSPATDPSRRIGSLVVNPGGPGASGVRFPSGVR